MAILSAAELEGLHVFGENERVVHGERIIEPAAGGDAVRSLLRVGVLEAGKKLAEVFAHIGLDTETVKVFFQQREVVRLPAHMGGALEARPIIPGLTLDALDNYAASDGGYDRDVIRGVDPVIDAGHKKYKLNSLFRDATLIDKLQISARRLQSAKRLALSDPSAAATGLTEYIQDHGFPNAVVLAGDYAKTNNNAVDFIRAMANTVVYSDLGAPAHVSDTHLEISFDQFELKDVIWTVRGPLKYATEVNAVYQLAIHYGPEYVIFLLCSETIQLGIDIRNEKTGDYYTGALHGYSSLSGIRPGGYSFPPDLTADQQAQLMRAGKLVSPIYSGKAVVGTAVHVSDKHAILNEHTLSVASEAEAPLELCGLPIGESMSVSGDVCVVRRGTAHSRWHFRDAVVGERVVLCYSVGESVEYTEVLQVLGSSDQLILSDSNILRKGASGAAVIALRDSALLGIFSTKRAYRVFCAPFTSTTFAVVSDCQSVASVSQYAGTPGLDTGNRTYAKMVERGLLGFLEGIERSVAPIYSVEPGGRRMAGLIANIGGEWRTTVDPDIAQLAMADGRLLSFRSAPGRTYVAENPPPVLQAVPNIRTAEPGERVFVFTKSDDDVIMSSVRVVTHTLVDGKAFVIEDFGDTDENMHGGLIVAERDAAVVGMYVSRDCDMRGVFTTSCAALMHVDHIAAANLTPDLQPVRAEFVSWVVPSGDSLADHVLYGRHVWLVALGRRAHEAGSTLTKALAVSDGLWQQQCRRLLELLQWPTADVSLLDKHGPDIIAAAYLAAVYLRHQQYAIVKLDLLLQSIAVDGTPLVGEFPFPRSVSAGSSTSRSLELDEARFLELEQRMLSRFSVFVSDHERRLSGLQPDVG